MAQALIRNIDDDLLEDYREAAKANARSLESELREALRRARPMTLSRRQDLIEAANRIAAMTPKGVRQTPSEQLIREDRDGYRGI
jgi:plasmid stability protein